MTKNGQLSETISVLKSRINENYVKDMFGQRKAIYQRVFDETCLEPQVIIVAKSLEAFLREKEIVLWHGDLMAGNAQLCNYTYSYPNSVEEEFRAIYLKDISQKGPYQMPATLKQFLTGFDTGLFVRAQGGHVVSGYDRVLVHGIGFLIDEAKRRLGASDILGHDFADASLIACEAASAYINRYADKAEQLTKEITDKRELKQIQRIASACRWIAVNPPRDFFEAIQLVWLTHEILTFEEVSGAMSVGRLDQYLYPYYAKDLAAGKLTRDEAGELIEALWLKFNGLRKGYQNVTLGGYRNDRYEANDLTYICLEATKKLRMAQPLISVRWHPSMPDELWQSIQELIQMGLGFPALFNDEIAIAAKRRMGVTQEDAENYGIIGCVEMTVPNKEYAYTEGLRMNVAKVLELMMNNGQCSITGEVIPLKQQRDLASIKSFTEFYQWYQDELCHFIDLGVNGLNFLDQHYTEYWPVPFLSSTMTNCLVKGHDVTAGGTVYNFSSINSCGMANVVDSLVTIKRLVFDDHKFSLPALAEILRHDFQNAEDIREEFVNKYPKYGNDNDEADHMIRELSERFCKQITDYTNPRGGKYQAGFYTVEGHSMLGKLTGALPDGHRRGVALANGFSPVQGVDIHGPTAVIKSITKVDHRMFSNGMVLDLKFHPAFFNSSKNREAFKSLIETYFKLGGMEIQFNVVSREILLEAQKSPEKYRDLIVRVSGFSAYFVELDPILQNEIIARTEYAAV